MKNNICKLFVLSFIIMFGLISCKSDSNSKGDSDYDATDKVEKILEKYQDGKDLSDREISALINTFDRFLKEAEKPVRDYNKAQRTRDVELERRAKEKMKQLTEKYYYMEDVKSCLDSYMYDMSSSNQQRYEDVLDRFEYMSR